ncbi:MAG: hypothetical protein A7316_00800 [Candidatus Altiarchaeales archaeon WOR_SM1_86-2]|nr:MAG: hypothetical protein A7316_00800 [Candidatus Altiarchaeales archaeon WOR_SM1_86-2]ODS41714.1 MAG: hypothetical protein A7315_00570 [Candidatus Altiarchaeales archaeon WOR_SM1_79]
MEKYYFTTRDLILMAVFGAMAGAFIMTTIPLKPVLPPGFPALIFIPASTIFMLAARGLVGKSGAATITGLIFGIVATILPGGPPLIPLAKYIIMGVVIDVFLLLIRKEVDSSRLVSTITGAVSYPFLAVVAYAGFMLLEIELPMKILGFKVSGILFVIIIFAGLHTVLGAVGGFLAYSILKRVRGTRH